MDIIQSVYVRFWQKHDEQLLSRIFCLMHLKCIGWAGTTLSALPHEPCKYVPAGTLITERGAEKQRDAIYLYWKQEYIGRKVKHRRSCKPL